MAGWQAGLLVLVQSVLQHMHVVLPANTAANNLQTGPAKSSVVVCEYAGAAVSTAPGRQSAWLAGKQGC